MSEKPENSRINQGGSTKWKPGQSGNPAGKPKGTRHKATMLAERLLDGQAEELIQSNAFRMLLMVTVQQCVFASNVSATPKRQAS